MAAMVGNASMTDLLIRRGAVVNGTDYHGSTPLHISCQKGHQSVAVSTHTIESILGNAGTGELGYDGQCDQENWSVICKIHRIHMTNT